MKCVIIKMTNGSPGTSVGVPGKFVCFFFIENRGMNGSMEVERGDFYVRMQES